nr:unnamed protein product [Callosobruchus chinensis]
MWLVSVIVLCEFSKINGVLIYPLFPGKPYHYSPPENDVVFYLYDRSNSSHAHTITIGNESSLSYSPFDPEIATVILVHGWTHGRDTPWLKEMRETMAETGYWNVIVLDWATLSHCIYIEARVHTTVVGKQLRRFLLFLVDNAGVNLDMVHLVGHSMGAHISGAASRQLWKKIGRKVGRITGLDPAAPLYEWPHIESMDDLLDRDDANFVDAIHTNGRHLGMMSPVGHVDFYPNGGQAQPGCPLWVCSHMRAVEYWIASLSNPELFKAYPYVAYDRHLTNGGPPPTAYPMGIAANPDMPLGIYYVETDFEFQRYVHSRTSLIDSFV